jgi:hypothetical protein
MVGKNSDVSRHEEPCDELLKLVEEVNEMRITTQTTHKLVLTSLGGIALFLFVVGFIQTQVSACEAKITKGREEQQAAEKAIVRIDENLRWIAEKLKDERKKTP